ncbi:TetR/AcrR family transcriptional regulator [Kordiimonas pumila]|uniref:TetR/AcrR family transcriptional regulator n=1 Tax=Kordiimonas pumila TaxID=2161677 RepID=A0ABV7D7N0_9PROT|nr:TetR/AcrR family transcriptional regulator [Kordiimonas pumila]
MSGQRRTRLSPEARKKQLLVVAIDLFAEKGIGEAKHADIARRSGMSTASTFVYFPTRDALLLDVSDEVSRYFLALFDGVQPEKGGAAAILRELAGRMLHAEDEHPNYVRVLLGFSTRFDKQLRDRYLAFQGELLTKVSEIIWAHSGLPRQDNRDDARILLSASQALAQMKLDGEPDEKLKRFIDHTIDVVLAFSSK